MDGIFITINIIFNNNKNRLNIVYDTVMKTQLVISSVIVK